jgi:signal transduction histidine kinase
VLEENRWLEFREWQLRALDGTVVDVEAASVPTVYRGRPAILTVLRDIGDRKRIERELRAALERAEEGDRLKRAFIANMSHEIRTPLNVVLGYASLLAEDLAQRGDASLAELVEPMERSARRLLRTLEGILELSRLEVGEFPVRPVRLRLAKAVEEAAGEYRLAARKKGLALRVEIEEPEAEVLFDEYCLAASLSHLLDNAVKFTPAGEVVTRVYRGRDGRLRLEVRDTGVGISPGFLPRVFEPFRQEDPGPTRRFEGVGIGLSLVRRYLAANGATISVRSQPGQGSSFEIRFAVEPEC